MSPIPGVLWRLSEDASDSSPAMTKLWPDASSITVFALRVESPGTPLRATEKSSVLTSGATLTVSNALRFQNSSGGQGGVNYLTVQGTLVVSGLLEVATGYSAGNATITIDNDASATVGSFRINSGNGALILGSNARFETNEFWRINASLTNAAFDVTQGTIAFVGNPAGALDDFKPFDTGGLLYRLKRLQSPTLSPIIESHAKSPSSGGRSPFLRGGAILRSI